MLNITFHRVGAACLHKLQSPAAMQVIGICRGEGRSLLLDGYNPGRLYMYEDGDIGFLLRSQFIGPALIDYTCIDGDFA